MKLLLFEFIIKLIILNNYKFKLFILKNLYFSEIIEFA
jgi:hypothetical protein